MWAPQIDRPFDPSVDPQALDASTAVRVATRLQQDAGNVATTAFLAHAQRIPGGTAPSAAKPVRTAIRIPAGRGFEPVRFGTALATVGNIEVRLTGRLTLSGSATISGRTPPRTKRSQWAAEVAREALNAVLGGTIPAGDGEIVTARLLEQDVLLELAPGAGAQMPWQVSGRFRVPRVTVSAPDIEVEGRTIDLDLGVWVSPARAAPQPGATPAPSGSPSAASAGAATPAGPSASAPAASPASTPAPSSAPPAATGPAPLAPAPGAIPEAPPAAGSLVRSFRLGATQAVFEGSRRRPKTAVAASQAALDAIERTVPSQVKADKSLASAEQRAWFLHTMRPFFGSDASTVGHFAQIREVAIKGARTLMHEEAAARLESVQQRLGEARMPSSSGVGWSFRSDFGPGTAPQSLGNLHHVGLAIDYNAYEAPHLGARGKTLDPRQTDLIRMVTGRAPGMELGGYDKTLPMLAELGRATMSGDREKIEEVEGRKDVRAFLDRVAAETDALSRASRRFRDSLGPGGARLQDLQKEYLAAGSEEARRKVTDQLPAVLAPWIKMVEADILQTRVAVVLGALNPFGPPVGEELHAERDRARKLWSRWEVVSKTIEGGAPLTPRLQRTASQLVQEAGTMLGVLAPAAPGPDFQSQFRALTPLLKTRTAALGHKIWLERLVALRAGLVGDPSFVLTSEVLTDRSGKVVRDKEGRPMPKPEAGLPPLAQLAEKGYFTLKDESTSASAFGPDFVMEMAKHGFNLGATYGDTPDSMHFELRWLQGRPPS